MKKVFGYLTHKIVLLCLKCFCTFWCSAACFPCLFLTLIYYISWLQIQWRVFGYLTNKMLLSCQKCFALSDVRYMPSLFISCTVRSRFLIADMMLSVWLNNYPALLCDLLYPHVLWLCAQCMHIVIGLVSYICLIMICVCFQWCVLYWNFLIGVLNLNDFCKFS